MRTVLLGLALLLASVSQLFATEYWVSTTGSGATPCANADGPTDPGQYRSITTVGSCMVAGDTAIVKAGTYTTGGTNISLPNGVNDSTFTLMRSENTTGTAVAQTLDVFIQANNNDTNIINLGGQHHIEFRGLVLQQGSGAANAVGINGGSTRIRFRNCEIKNIVGNQGFLVEEGNDNNEFIDLNVHHVGPSGFEHGGYISSDDNLVQGGEWHDNVGQGIQFTNSASSNEPDRNRVLGVKFYNNGIYGVVIRGVNPYVENTLFYDNGAGLFMAGSGGKALNCTFYSNTGDGISIGNAGNAATSTTVSNGIFYQNGTAIADSGSTTSLQTNFTSGNPLFVSAPSNLRLSSGSPAIGAATTRAEFSTDLEGVTRTVPWDQGAYEFSSGGGSPSISVLVPNGGQSWATGSSQTVAWSSQGTSGTVDINEDQDGNGSYETVIANDTADDGSHAITVSGSANANRKMQICDSDGSPCDVSDAVYAVTSSPGGTITKRISDNTTGTKIGDIPGVEDTYMWSNAPTTNYENFGTVFVVRSGSGDDSHGLIKFAGLSQIPTNATVSAVRMGFYVSQASGATSQSWDIRKVLRSVVENQVTWNQYSTGNNWTTAGGLGSGTDRVNTASATISGIGTTQQFYEVSSTGQLKDDIQAIVTTPANNHYFHLQDTTDGDVPTRGFVDSEGTNGQRPYLEVDYTTTAATITVTQPTAGALVFIGDLLSIRWDVNGVSGNVRIDASHDDGATYQTIVASTAFNSPDVTWTAEGPTGSLCRVKVVSLNDTAVFGVSPAFRIGGIRPGFKLN